MTWFKVDDKLHSNNKTRKVLADDPAALALWVVAGSWSSDLLTDGFVPDHQLPWLIPVGADELARKLVTARFWRRVRGGYQFHEWTSDSDGTKRNPTREEVEDERRKKAEAGRKGGLASGKTRSRRQARASASASPTATARASPVVEPPTRPDPTVESSSNSLPQPDGFEEFWRTYPPRRHSSKADARKAYTKALKEGADLEDILAGTRAYANDRNGKDQQFTAHASTWLNGKRWEVQLETRPTTPTLRPFWEA